MMAKVRLYGIILMSLILIFSIIHFGVSIGIIVKNRNYGNIFRPETGLSSFNIVISILGLAVGIVGLICVLTSQRILGKIVALLSIILGIFALASLVAAIIINSKSFSYVNTRFATNMNQYFNDPNAMNIIDRIQKGYTCCGQTSWLDWALFQSGSTNTSTTSITTTVTMPINTTTTLSNETTPTGTAATTVISSETGTGTASDTTTGVSGGTTMGVSGETATGTSGETATGTSGGTTMGVSGETATGTSGDTTTALTDNTTASVQAKSLTIPSQIHSDVRREIDTANLLSSASILLNRQQRQATSTSANTAQIQYSNLVSFPASCCDDGGSSSNNPSQTICSSPPKLYANGCLISLVQRSNQQDMGIGIINCFMIALAFMAAPFLLRDSMRSNSHEKKIYGQQLENITQFDLNPNNNFPSIINTFH